MRSSLASVTSTKCFVISSFCFGEQAGADPNHCSPREGTPLDIAVSKGDTQIVKCLLKARADPNFTNEVSYSLSFNIGVVIVLQPFLL